VYCFASSFWILAESPFWQIFVIAFALDEDVGSDVFIGVQYNPLGEGVSKRRQVRARSFLS
jgi:hypothetical protein